MKEAANCGGFSYNHERESRSQNDQCIYASDHDAEINVGHEPLRLELGFPTEHRASLRLHTSSRRWAFVRWI